MAAHGPSPRPVPVDTQASTEHIVAPRPTDGSEPAGHRQAVELREPSSYVLSRHTSAVGSMIDLQGVSGEVTSGSSRVLGC